MAEQGKEVMKIEFTKSRDYRTIAATGAWGGPNPQGEIICNFFVERQKFPEDLSVEVNPITKQGVNKTQKNVEILREIQVSVVLRPDIAKNVGKWLMDKADLLLSANAKTTVN